MNPSDLSGIAAIIDQYGPTAGLIVFALATISMGRQKGSAQSTGYITPREADRIVEAINKMGGEIHATQTALAVTSAQLAELGRRLERMEAKQ